MVPVFGVKMAWDKEENYVKKEHLLDYAKKSDLDEKADKSSIEILQEEIEKKADKSLLETLQKVVEGKADKKELEKKASISELQERVCISDFVKHKAELEEKYAKKQEIPDISTLVDKKELNQYLLKKDLPESQDLSAYVKKDEVYTKQQTKDWFVKREEINKYVKKSELNTETCYCMVKLLNNFLPYDGNDWEFEFYMGNRGNWRVVYDTHKKLTKPDEYIFWTPFPGLYTIDFCYTCRRDTHLIKPQALQRIRMSDGWEFINFTYYDNPPANPQGNDVTTRTFRDRVEFLLGENTWIKFSMQFTNRANSSKRKNWLHTVGSDGGYSPTYFSISGRKREI